MISSLSSTQTTHTPLPKYLQTGFLTQSRAVPARARSTRLNSTADMTYVPVQGKGREEGGHNGPISKVQGHVSFHHPETRWIIHK